MLALVPAGLPGPACLSLEEIIPHDPEPPLQAHITYPVLHFLQWESQAQGTGLELQLHGSLPPELYTKILEHPFIFETRVPPLLTLT